MKTKLTHLYLALMAGMVFGMWLNTPTEPPQEQGYTRQDRKQFERLVAKSLDGPDFLTELTERGQ